MKFFILIIFSTFNLYSVAQTQTRTEFPILTKNQKILWQDYNKAKNVNVENDSSFSFDLISHHYKIINSLNYVRTRKILKSELTKNKNDKDSIIKTKIFLLPCNYMGEKVIIVQVSYIYDTTSKKLKEFWMTPLLFFRNFEDAKKKY